MKTIQLHPASLLVGAAVVGLAFLTMAQNPQPINPTWSPRNPQPIVLLRDYVQIHAGIPYTVPPNKILMITALGGTQLSQGGTAFLMCNGSVVTMRTHTLSGAPFDVLSLSEVPRGLTFNGGDILTVNCPTSIGTDVGLALGYLADA